MGGTRKSDYNSIFATKLRGLLASKSVSMTSLAKELGVKQQTVSQWADGFTTPALKHLKPLALYFGISIDELVTGVAAYNEETHLNTGLSNQAIEILKRLNPSDVNNKADGKITIEFLNIIIESMYSESFNLARLARQCMDYVVGAHKHLLWQEEASRNMAADWEYFSHVDRPNLKNDDLDFKTYQLTKYFEYFIDYLAKNPKIEARTRRIYTEGNYYLPDYYDSRIHAPRSPERGSVSTENE